MTQARLEAICPFFIASDVARSIAFYRDKLGFQVRYQEPQQEPFFVILGREGAQLFLKSGSAAPLPNPSRDPDMRWDAYVLTFEPDALAAAVSERELSFSAPLADTHDGLRGFEVRDPDGYVLFFGCPKSEARG